MTLKATSEYVTLENISIFLGLPHKPLWWIRVNHCMFITYLNESWLSKVMKDRTILIISFERNGLLGVPSFCKIWNEGSQKSRA